MNITQELAYPIIQRLARTVKHNLNIIDHQGVIIASTDPTRLHAIHEGAQKVLETRESLIIEKEQTCKFLGTKEGVNLPIEFMDEIIGVVGITGNPAQLIQIAEMTKITVELMLQQNYIRRQAHIEQQLMESWITELIGSNEVDEKKLAKHAQHYLDINVNNTLVVCLLRVPDLFLQNNLEGFIKRTESKESIYRVLGQCKQDLNLVFYGTTLDHDIVIGIALDSLTTEIDAANKIFTRLSNQNQQLFSQAKLAIGNRNHSIRGIQKSYDEARQALNLMNKFNRQSSTSQVNEWGMIRLLDQVPVEIREEYLRQYPFDKLGPELSETLDVLFECDHNLTETAKKLHVHRNTLSYRLDSIRQIIKLNPKSGNDLSIIYTLMILQKLSETKTS
ncbi:CdaR family transcriptional regulator [Bacillus sp. AK128]